MVDANYIYLQKGSEHIMRVAVACDGNQVSPHFGRCERFLIADIDGGQVTVRQWLAIPGHQPGLLPQLMAEQEVDCVLAGGAGPRAIGMFTEAGIEFIAGVSGDAAEVLAALAEGTLEPGKSSCEH